MSTRPVLVVGVIFACWNVHGARAEQLVLIPSTTQVLITPNYVGASVALFGSVQSAAVQEDADYDVVITVIGPRQTFIARRKRRILGVWANAESRTFANVPTYLEVLTNRGLDSITAPRELLRQQIGLEHAIPAVSTDRDAPFRAALIRLQSESGDYAERADAITFFSPTVFRTEVALPSNAQVGTYHIDGKLFARGELVAQTQSAFTVAKTGLVQFIASAARDHGLLYGLTITAMALAMGWIASIVFQRD
jgi:uncharacterized protein (TIGR02186 family)